MKTATVIADASYCPETGAAGWAVWIAMDGGAKIKKHAIFTAQIDNSTDAECKAVLNGIYMAAKKGAAEILVQSDCLAALTMVDTRNFPNGIGLPKGLVLTTKHVRGHTKNRKARYWCNRWCDEMAYKRMVQKRRIIQAKERINERLRALSASSWAE